MRHVELILVKAWAEIKSEASRAYIGFAWWFIEPILYMGAFYLLFGTGLRYGGEHFVYFLLCGLLPWKWFASTLSNGSQALPANIGLIYQVYLPKYIFPLVTVTVNTAKFLLVLPLLLLFLHLSGFAAGASWLALPALIVCQFLLIAASTALLSGIIPYLPDLRYVIDNGLLLMMFLSGVFFDLNAFDGLLGMLLRLNPVAVLLDGYRTILIDGAWPTAASFGYLLAWAAAPGLLAWWLLKRIDRTVIKVI